MISRKKRRAPSWCKDLFARHCAPACVEQTPTAQSASVWTGSCSDVGYCSTSGSSASTPDNQFNEGAIQPASGARVIHGSFERRLRLEPCAGQSRSSSAHLQTMAAAPEARGTEGGAVKSVVLSPTAASGCCCPVHGCGGFHAAFVCGHRVCMLSDEVCPISAGTQDRTMQACLN